MCSQKFWQKFRAFFRYVVDQLIHPLLVPMLCIFPLPFTVYKIHVREEERYFAGGEGTFSSSRGYKLLLGNRFYTNHEYAIYRTISYLSIFFWFTANKFVGILSDIVWHRKKKSSSDFVSITWTCGGAGSLCVTCGVLKPFFSFTISIVQQVIDNGHMQRCSRMSKHLVEGSRKKKQKKVLF